MLRKFRKKIPKTEPKKSKTKRCVTPFVGIKNHSITCEKDVRKLNQPEVEKCARLWPEKNLTTDSLLCFKCRLHIFKAEEGSNSLFLKVLKSVTKNKGRNHQGATHRRQENWAKVDSQRSQKVCFYCDFIT